MIRRFRNGLRYCTAGINALMLLLPIERQFSAVSAVIPLSSSILLLNRLTQQGSIQHRTVQNFQKKTRPNLKSVRFTNVSNPSIFEMLLKDRSSHSRFVKCWRFSICSTMLLSSCSFTREFRPLRLSIFRMDWKLKLRACEQGTIEMILEICILKRHRQYLYVMELRISELFLFLIRKFYFFYRCYMISY